MEDIQKLKNQISVLRSLLREKEEKLRIAEAIEKEKDELWLQKQVQGKSDNNGAGEARLDASCGYSMD